MAEALAPLRIVMFRRLWLANIFSNVGGFFQTVAAAWLMKGLTNSSATWIGLMVASTFLPLLVFGLIAGVVADTFDKARVMTIALSANALAATAMAILTVTDLITPPILLGLGLLMGTGSAFSLPAWQALVSHMVPPELVPSAIALNSAAFNVARAIGPAIAGAVVATVGPEMGFGINAVSFLGVIGVGFSMTGARHTGRINRATLSSAVGMSLRYARFTPAFRSMLILVAMFGLTSAAIQSTLPNRTTELGGNERTYGLLLGAMGVGALVAAFGRSALHSLLRRGAVPASMTGFGVAGMIIGWSTSLAMVMIAMGLSGACWVWTLTTFNASSQLMAPEWVRGRAMSLYTLSFSGMYPIGAIVSGVVADRIGAGATDVMMSAMVVALGLSASRFNLPILDEIKIPLYEEERSAPTHVETEGGPVMVINTWSIERPDLESFLEVLSEVRLIRLKTGAYRWRLYRNAQDPHRLSEVFVCTSWEEHLAQHQRIDDASAAVIKKARAFDSAGGPRTRHLVAVDVDRPADWEPLLAAHEEYHRTDGSIPLAE